MSLTLPRKLKVDRGRRRQHVELVVQSVKVELGERLHENICGMVSTKDESHLQVLSGDLFVNKIKINFDVFGASIKDGISCEIGSIEIITMKC